MAQRLHRPELTVLAPGQARSLALSALSVYWNNSAPIEALPLTQPLWPEREPLPPRLESVALPDWAADAAVDGKLLVPTHRIEAGLQPEWQRVDWLGAASWYLHGAAERAHEGLHGPIHSYAFRLKDWDTRLWQHAWVNRIALFLRRWAARAQNAEEAGLLGPLPHAEILLTHDIDAIAVTTALRLKQSAFHCFNAARALALGKPRLSARKLAAAWRFSRSSGSLWHLDDVAASERARGVRSHFFVYAGAQTRSIKQKLFDPHYDIEGSALARTVAALAKDRFNVGLHQSFDTWSDHFAMATEKRRLESAIGLKVDSCRQHWLRFSWRDTWEAQERAGFRIDTTLGFNDRPGFRNGAALRLHPWNPATGRALALTSIPMILMDSQLFDYDQHSDEGSRAAEVERWLAEVRNVRGVVTVISHPHTLGHQYGWRPVYDALLAGAAKGHT